MFVSREDPASLTAGALGDFVLAWTVTPLFSGAVAAAVYALVR
jgi:phosphate/sulfate permease